MLGLGVGEIVVISLGLMLLFGARKIPLIARGLGEGIRNFKGEVTGGSADGEKRPPSLEDGERGRKRPD